MRYTAEQITTQSDLVSEAVAELAQRQARLSHMLSRNATPMKPGPKAALLNGYGKLSEHGEKVMYDMFEAGDRDSDIAEHFSITPSAVHGRRRRWRALQTKARQA